MLYFFVFPNCLILHYQQKCSERMFTFVSIHVWLILALFVPGSLEAITTSPGSELRPKLFSFKFIYTTRAEQTSGFKKASNNVQSRTNPHKIKNQQNQKNKTQTEVYNFHDMYIWSWKLIFATKRELIKNKLCSN